jgi:hypothetical protein
MVEVLAGQHFTDAQPTVFGRRAPVWMVINVFIGTDGKQYAHIGSLSNPQDRKTLSTAILRDRRRFVLLDKMAAG